MLEVKQTSLYSPTYDRNDVGQLLTSIIHKPNFLSQYFSDYNGHINNAGILLKFSVRFRKSGVTPRVCISNKFPVMLMLLLHELYF